MHCIFRYGPQICVPDGTLVYPMLNAMNRTADLSVALGEISGGQKSKIHMHPVVTLTVWVISGKLAITLKDPPSQQPYTLEIEAEEAGVAGPGTFVQLIN